MTARIRLDQFLVSRISGESRSQIQNWIRKGYLRVNGEQVKTGYRTKRSDRIELDIPEALPEQPFPEDIPLDILYEDSDLAVINKPAGLVCHAGAGIRSGTLVNALLHHMGPLETGDSSRPGIVHRLDKLTSGVMLVAKNKQAHRQLSQQFKSRRGKEGIHSPCPWMSISGVRNNRHAPGERSCKPQKDFHQSPPKANRNHSLRCRREVTAPSRCLASGSRRAGRTRFGFTWHRRDIQ